MNYNSTVVFLLNEDCSMVVALSASRLVQRANKAASYHDSFLLIAEHLTQNDLVSHNVSWEKVRKAVLLLVLRSEMVLATLSSLYLG